MQTEIAAKARFDDIRYAQLWEDADVLVSALASKPGATLISICSAGDNALAMLTLDPARVIAIDLSKAQLACLSARMAAMRTVEHREFLELMGSRPSNGRAKLFDRMVDALESDELREFWRKRRSEAVKNGLGGVGKFERYFAVFRKWFLPLAHNRKTIDAIFVSKPKKERQVFLDRKWNNWRWRLLLKLFFSQTIMGRFGRDPAFFAHVQGSVADHVAERIRHAAVDLDPSENPYLHWILKGTHGDALPMAWREEHYETIRNRLDRLELRHGALESLAKDGITADGFNLSDIFEYMNLDGFDRAYGNVLRCANLRARLVYWNMMAPRRFPAQYHERIRTLIDAESRGKSIDKAFFYADFVVEEVIAT